jgi:hypothetical protein
MAPELLLKCGCRMSFEEDQQPICRTHGNQPIVRVLNMPPPRIRGTATGPLVRTEDLEPFRGRLVGPEKGAA